MDFVKASSVLYPVPATADADPAAPAFDAKAIAALRQARWIWPTAVYAPLRNATADFVLDVELADADLPRAILAVTADANYVAWLNGRYVGRGPARGWQAAWPCDGHEVGTFLRPGLNRLAIRVYNPGRDTFRYVHQNAAGLLAALVDGSGRPLASTGPAWRCRLSPSRSRLTPQLSIQLEDQEHVDLRADEWSWRLPGASLTDWPDLPAESSVDLAGTAGHELRWHAPAQCRAAGSPPWTDLEPRGLPHLTGERRGYGSVVSRAVGPVQAAAVANPPAELRANAAALRWTPPDAHDEADELTLGPVEAGEARVVVLDLGEPTLGTICLKLAGGTRGARLDVVPFEVCDDAGRPQLPDPLAEGRVAVGLRLTLSGGPESFESFHAYGHRYLALVLHGGSRPLRVRPLVRETLYPVEERGSFRCDDASLDAVRRTCARTQRIAMTDAYIDAWREQAQWWGDARVQFFNHQALGCDDRLFRRGIQQIATQRLGNGLTYGHAPTGAFSCVLPDFSLAWLLTLADHWWQTGSPELAVRHRDDVSAVLDYFRVENRGLHGLLCNDPRYWLFLDWAEIPKDGCPTLLNLWHVHALDRLVTAYEAAGDELAAELAGEAAERRALVSRLLFDAERGLWRDGLECDGRPRETYGTHAQALAILADFEVTPAMRQQVRAALSPAADGCAAEPSPFWIGYLFQAATRLGYGEDVLACIRRRWERMVRQGSTFEVWRPTLQESRSHAWSAHPLTHLNRLVAGVRSVAPGWSEVQIAPPWTTGEVGWCEATVPTPRGLIRVGWTRAGDQPRLDVSLPPGVRATVALADGKTVEMTGSRTFGSHAPVDVSAPARLSA